MLDINTIISKIKGIDQAIATYYDYCRKITEEINSVSAEYQSGEKSLIINIRRKIKDYLNENFDDITKRCDEIERSLSKYCPDVFTKKITGQENSLRDLSVDELNAYLDEQISLLNEKLTDLNNLDFDSVLPPQTITKKKGKIKISYGGNDKTIKVKEKTKWTRERQLPDFSKKCESIYALICKIRTCFKTLSIQYEKEFNLDSFTSEYKKYEQIFVKKRQQLLNEEHNLKQEEMLGDGPKSILPYDFCEQVRKDENRYSTDLGKPSTIFGQSLMIGHASINPTENASYLSTLTNTEWAKRNLQNNAFKAPVLIDLKTRGNIVLNVEDDNFNDNVNGFVHQIVMQYLLAFPASRINLCMVDIDNRCTLSGFNVLKKINNDIFFGNGIIRDDRIVDDTIKDLENVMYKINDDVLSYNNVKDIYEYNSKYEANMQNVYLFVLVNFPSSFREETITRIAKIMNHGNKTGIFTLLVNNTEASKTRDSRKTELLEKALQSIKSNATIFKSNSNGLFLTNEGVDYKYNLIEEINISKINDLTRLLQNDAEQNKQKVITLKSMFDESDSQVSRKTSAEVLDIPIGSRGGEVQNLLLKTTGDGSAHAVVIGGTGSGKSNLLHTIILNTCYKYSPEEVNLYLVDFKGGVEFKYYEANKNASMQLPHIKLTGLTSDLEDGVAILNNLRKELRRREDDFRRIGVEDIVQYRNLGYSIPRLFVIIDEIQELFEQDDKLGQKAIDILREVFKKGRAFGINVLWASQNVPNAPGLKDKILSQIGNRISLRLNNPDDALDIKIDPKMVIALNRPEKGLGVIGDIRYGNDSVEFRVAYAENSENRKAYTQMIIDKWKDYMPEDGKSQLFIVGDDEDPIPGNDESILTTPLTKENIRSKAFESYSMVLGKDYITGNPFTMPISVRNDKDNAIFVGPDSDIIRDMMAFSMMSLIVEHITNEDYQNNKISIKFANGELISPKTENHILNLLKYDFESVIDNVSSPAKFKETLAYAYKLYKERRTKIDESETAIKFTPLIFVINSMQRYANIFEENPRLSLNQTEVKETDTANPAQSAAPATDIKSRLASLKEQVHTIKPVERSGVSHTSSASTDKPLEYVAFNDAFIELLLKAGQFGIHFVVSLDSFSSIPQLKSRYADFGYIVLTKGINSNVLSSVLSDYKLSASLTNPKIAVIVHNDEKTKVKVYRCNETSDGRWYNQLRSGYRRLREEENQ